MIDAKENQTSAGETPSDHLLGPDMDFHSEAPAEGLPLEKKELPRKREDDIAHLEARITNLTEELEKRETELAATRDASLRAIAEADNYKKRLEREREERKKRDEAELVASMLPVLDNLEKALETAVTDKSGWEKLREGIERTKQQFHDILSRKGLVRIQTLNKQFDPNTSEALTVEDTSEHEDGLVIREYFPGYMLNGTVLRAARVAVARNASDQGAGAGHEENPV